MEGLDAAAEDLGEGGELGHLDHGHAGLLEGGMGAAGAHDLEAEPGQALIELDQTLLVVH